MKTVRLKVYASPTMTAEEAIRRFAAEYWEDTRSPGIITPPKSPSDGYAFQLSDGRAWYRADPTGVGWIISLIIPGDEPASPTTI
jgi:hypothetical protein